MKPTTIRAIDAHNPEPETLAEAAAILRADGLVAFPTETVYGLGANALSAKAVDRVFAAKGRPRQNPLIVHVAEIADVLQVAANWPENAAKLARRFWPGPLTLVLPRNPRIPNAVTAGGPTVAVRMPAHPVALALLRAAGLPLAAPSANRSGKLSPTTAQHVGRMLNGHIDLILDAGPTTVGLESTVLDLTANPPRLLRPGLVSRSEIESVLGCIIVGVGMTVGEPLRSPGLLDKHYAPGTPTECWPECRQRVVDLATSGRRVGWLTFDEEPTVSLSHVVMVRLPRDPIEYAARMYAELHDLDQMGLERIIVEMPPESEEWLAIRDRLRRASAQV